MNDTYIYIFEKGRRFELVFKKHQVKKTKTRQKHQEKIVKKSFLSKV